MSSNRANENKDSRELNREWLRNDPIGEVGPVWCPVANMNSERSYGPGGSETRRGSRHFAAGAKLYVRQIVGQHTPPQLEVIGRHRASHRYVTMIVSANWLINWRAELIYSPRVILDLWPQWNGSPASKKAAEKWARSFSELNTAREETSES